ncbi:hypothetical protein E2C01_069067 [Portunus trituberculatus]|uniref:Uncharacterized protein n=1 Tax=Portunus trituberculatus TaxID=210409 RepID=A0A5B7I1T8_PORTR|nr:hypothetical protein [Portunus trituberculatus]
MKTIHGVIDQLSIPSGIFQKSLNRLVNRYRNIKIRSVLSWPSIFSRSSVVDLILVSVTLQDSPTSPITCEDPFSHHHNLLGRAIILNDHPNPYIAPVTSYDHLHQHQLPSAPSFIILPSCLPASIHATSHDFCL